jgi:hypothetical protein
VLMGTDRATPPRTAGGQVSIIGGIAAKPVSCLACIHKGDLRPADETCYQSATLVTPHACIRFVDNEGLCRWYEPCTAVFSTECAWRQ